MNGIRTFRCAKFGWEQNGPADVVQGIFVPQRGDRTLDITRLILDDHSEQRRLFEIIEQIDPTDTKSLASVWKRLSTFLEVHAETEEKIFYPALLRVGKRA